MRDHTILMLSMSEARTQTAPQPQTQFTANLNFYLVQLSLSGLSQSGVHRAPKGLDQSIGIHYKKNSLYGSDFQISEVSVLRQCAHGCTALRLPGAKGSSE